MRERPENFALKRDHPLAKGLVFAGLGRAPGSVRYIESSGYGNHGTLTNMTPAEDWVWVPELGRWALDYDGTNDYVDCGGSPIVTEPFTICGWLKIDAYTTAVGIAACHSPWSRWSGIGTNRAWVTGVGYEDRFTVTRYDTTGYKVRSTANYSLSTWYHVTGVFNSTSLRSIWINGQWIAENTTSVTTGIDDELWLGREKTLNVYSLNGRLADPMVFKRVLSSAEIQQLADPSNVMLSGLILPPRRKYYVIKPTTTTTYKYLIFKQNNKILPLKGYV